jgi:hypothetical protein
MKRTFLAALVWIGSTLGLMAQLPPFNPPPDWVNNWDNIREPFLNWKIDKFEYRGEAADGGSKGFKFHTTDGTEFYMVVLCSWYWTKEDLAKNQQPIHLWTGDKRYCVEAGSEIEARLIAMMDRAAEDLRGDGRKHPKYLTRLREEIKSRDTRLHEEWPHDPLEFESDPGDWTQIEDRFFQWKISEFVGWGMTDASSFLFRFKASDGSDFGVFVPFWGVDLNEPTRATKSGNADPFAASVAERELEVYIHFDSRLFRIERGAKTESRLLAMLKQAAGNLEEKEAAFPKYLDRLRVTIETRGNKYTHFPMTDAEYEGE